MFSECFFARIKMRCETKNKEREKQKIFAFLTRPYEYELNGEQFESNYYLFIETSGEQLYRNRALLYLDDLMTFCKCEENDTCVGYTGLSLRTPSSPPSLTTQQTQKTNKGTSAPPIKPDQTSSHPISSPNHSNIFI